MKENMRACSICGSLHPVSELTEFDDHYLCSTCLRTETVCCDECYAMDFHGLQLMAEQLEGTFTITALTEKDELYIVKGNNPMCIYHYPQVGLYVYASTEDILKRAMLKALLPLGKAEKVDIISGEILRIDAKGKVRRSHFDDSNLYVGFSRDWDYWANYDPVRRTYADNSEYLEDLKSIAVFYGLYPEDIDAMIEDGMDPMEIEELLYCG